MLLVVATGWALPTRAKSATTDSACEDVSKRGHHDKAIADARRGIERATTPAERARANLELGQAQLDLGIELSYPLRRPGAKHPPCRSNPAATTGSLRQAAEAFRLAAEDDGAVRQEALLGLADALVRLGTPAKAAGPRDDYLEAAAALQKYSAGGGDVPLADDLRCWLDFALGSSKDGSHAPEDRLHFTDEDGLQPAVKVSGGGANYTDSARRAGVTGMVVVLGIIDEEGRIACARPVSKLAHGLDRAAADSIRTWRYRPATLGGKPVAVASYFFVNFTMSPTASLSGR